MAKKPLVEKGSENSPYSSVELFSSGCTELDCVLGGGYPLSRMVNIWGDKSTGKTLLALEACANFANKYENGFIWYNETESAFDSKYAHNLGIPMDRVDLLDHCETIEDVFEHLDEVMKTQPDDAPGLYIVDSIDALTTRMEMQKDGTGYNTSKALLMGQLLRKYSRRFEKKRICLMLISQSRVKINATFIGRNVQRSGGKAIDFFMSQIIYLAQIKVLKRTIRKVERPYGVLVKAKCDKNKIGPPFRECEFEIVFSFGIDDVKSGLTFLDKTGNLKDDQKKGKASWPFLSKINDLPDDRYRKTRQNIRRKVFRVWDEIESDFLPTRKKY